MEILDFAKKLAVGAGEIVKDRYSKKNQYSTKTGIGDIVTEADLMSEKYLIDQIKELRPDDSILSEESGVSGHLESEYTWVLDPIDGTRNFAIGIPFFCVSIGCLKNGVPYIGVIYDPLHDEMFYAQRGDGAFLNNKKIQISQATSLEDAMLSICWVKEKADKNPFLECMKAFSEYTSYFRRYGSAALVMSYIACGRLDAYVQAGLCPWDVAAAMVIVEEAGGLITDFKGKPVNLNDKVINVIAANKYFHEKLLDHFKEY